MTNVARTNPLVSIVIPNYNNAQYLKQCLDSCINQSYTNIEVIVVDDCSTDNSIEIIGQYISADSRIRLIQNETNQKVSASRNIGIQQSSGDYITTLDSDDYLYTTRKIKSELKALQSKSDERNQISFSMVKHVSEGGRPYWDKNAFKFKEGKIYDSLLKRSCFIPRNYMLHRSTLLKSGLYNIQIPIYEDWDLTLRLGKKASFVFSGAIGIAYRQHSYGLSSSSLDKNKKWFMYVFEKNAKNHDDYPAMRTLAQKTCTLGRTPSLTSIGRIKMAISRRLYK